MSCEAGPRRAAEKIPAMLVGLRILLAPVLFFLIKDGRFHVTAVLYAVAVVSDIYDGVIARRLGVSTLRLRLAEGYADIWLYFCVGVGIYFGCRELLAALAPPFFISMALQGGSWLFCLVRFGRITSYHSMLAKLTGLALLAGILSLLTAGASLPLVGALWIFVLNLIEEIAMTALLPKYHHDVWNIKAALLLRHRDLPEDKTHEPT